MSDLVALYAPHALFLAIWFATPLALIVATRAHLVRADAPVLATPDRSRADRAAIVATAAFFGVYVFLVLYGEDLVGPDYAQLTAQRFFAMPIWAYNRRFFPLGLQEYNVLGLVAKNATLYHTFSVVQMGVVVACVFRILISVPVWLRCAACVFLAVVPSIAVSFFGLIYPERDIVFWMALWLCFLLAHMRTGSRATFAATLISTQFLLYYKEIAFLFVGTFAVGKLMLDAYRDRPIKAIAAFARGHVLELSHLILCAVFLGVYLFEMRSATDASYAINVGRRGAALAALQFYVRWDPLLVGLGLAVASRLVLVVTGKRAAEPVWDSLAVAAVVYVSAYVKLAMIKDYYPTPADFIGVLYLARLAYVELRATSRVIRVAASVVVVLVFARNVHEVAYSQLSRKEYVAANKQMTDALERISAAERVDTLSLFFPKVGGFQLMEFSAYLRFRDFYLPGDPAPRRPGQTVVVVKGPHQYLDGRCQSFQFFRCEYARERAPGDFVVYLPGRAVTADDLAELSATTRVFQYSPGNSVVERVLYRLAYGDRLTDRPAHSYVFRP